MDDDTTLFSLSLLLLLSLKTASFFLSLSLLSNVSLSPRLYTKVPLFRYTMNGLSKKRARERDDDDDVLNDSEFSSFFFFFFFFFFSKPRKAPARSLCSSSSSTREQAKMCRLLLLRRRPLDRVFRVYFLVKYLGFPQKYVSFFSFFFFLSLDTQGKKRHQKKIIEERRAFASKEDHYYSGTFITSRERARERERETTKAHRRDSIRVCVAREGSAVSFFFLFQGERRARSLCLGRESESALIGKPKRKARPLFLSFFLSFCHRRRRR